MIIDHLDVDEAADIRSTLAALLDKRSDPAAVRRAAESANGYDEKLFAELAELGFTALPVPESAGGLEMGPSECAVVWFELGRRLVPGPVADTLAAALVLSRAGASEQLESIVAGERWALARSDGSDRLDFVAGGAGADRLLVVEPRRVLCAQGFRPSALPVMDQTQPLATVDLSGAELSEIGGPELAELAERVVLSVQAVAASAAAERALELTVDYLKVREQFGRPLGSFQALKHRCADLVVQVRGAHAIAMRAVAGLSEGSSEVPEHTAAVARVIASDALFRCAAEAVQLHGGIGITWEHDIQLFLKRAKASQLLWRTQAELRAELLVCKGFRELGD